MSKSHILLDSLELTEPLSKYIEESKDLDKSAALNNTPSLLKFIVSEKKDFIDNMNENKFRGIKDNVTDAFVNTFFIGPENYEKLNMLLDYQYHFIYFNIMLDVNSYLMQQGPSNRDDQKIEIENLYPLQDNEHILLNFKGGSTMYYLYNNIIDHLRKQGKDITQFKDITDYFKISDIDLALNIETDNSYRYFQLESIVSYLLTRILEDLTNKLEFMYLNTICSNLEGGNDPTITAKIAQIKASLKLNEPLDHLKIIILQNASRVYTDIYAMKLAINALKKKLILDVTEANITEAFDFIQQFIEYDNITLYSTLKSVDMLEISLITEFVTYMTHINYNRIANGVNRQLNMININLKLKDYGNHLLNVKYDYLLNNFYNTLKFDIFINSIKTRLQDINTSSLKKAKDSYAAELASGKLRTRICETDEQTDAADGRNYFQDYRYFTETKSERKSHYNLVSDNAEITNDKINFSGRENFFLRPQDSSKFPYVIVTTKNTGLNSADIKDLKQNIINVAGNKVRVKFPNAVIKELDFTNETNVHYLSINKSIFMENNRYVTTFNLFRIKFNVTLANLIESISIDALNKCVTDLDPTTNTPSEFLDVGVGSKDDTFHSVVDEIEEHNNGIVFNITYNVDPVRTVPEVYGKESRILSYSIKTFAADLNNVLYCQQKIPWLDLKYQKRLFRLLFYIFNVLQNEHVANPAIENANTIINDVFQETLFNNIDHTAINYDNIVTHHNDFTLNGRTVDNMIQDFITQISIAGSDISMTTITIKDLILSDRELHNHLLLAPKYKIANGFFSYTIIYILLIKKLKDEIAANPINQDAIIAEYSKLIQIFYDRSGITFNIKNYNNNNEMNQLIVKGFINDFGSYIDNIKKAIKVLKLMFTQDFNYKAYDKLPINS
jgi:hypothetical protein